MPRLFLGNFDFEYRLRSTGSSQLPRTVARTNEELACLWAAVADEGDLIWTPARVEESFFDELAAAGLPRVRPVLAERDVPERVALCPWGWTEAVREWGESRGWKCDAPPQAIVRRLNSRRFSFDLEQQSGSGLPGSAAVGSMDELAAALRKLPRRQDRWVVKAEFGMSARERIVGRGRDLTEPAAGWVRKRLAADGVVFVEPWIAKIEEAGLQLTVPPSGPPRLEGVTPLLTDAVGVYRGSRFVFDPQTDARWSPAVETAVRVAENCQTLGYFGPLGIDAVRWRNAEGQEHLRPLQDINARWTMGRLSLGLRKLLRAAETGTWLHVRWPTDGPDSPREWFEKFVDSQPPGTRVIRTSRFVVGGEPVSHGTLAVVSGRSDAHSNTPVAYHFCPLCFMS